MRIWIIQLICRHNIIGAPISINLNCGIFKVLLSFLILSDQYNTTPLDVNFTAIDTIQIGASNNKITIIDKNKSNILFI